MAQSDLPKGFILGAAAVIVGQAIVRLVPGSGTPLARAIGRGGLVIAEKAQEAAAEIGEVFEDTLAELKGAYTAAQSAQQESPEQPVEENQDV